MGQTYTYFKDEEVKGLEKELCAMLDMARGKAGIPFFITSGLRSSDHNSELKGSAMHSAHLADENGLAKAVDLLCPDDHSLWTMLFGLYMAGFRRFGLYFTQDNLMNLIPRHIHVDIADDNEHPLEVIFCKIEQN